MSPTERVFPIDTKFAALFDVDGTIALNEWRRHFVERAKSKKDWKAFNLGMCNDKPSLPVVAMLHACKAIGLHTLLVTGRSEDFREVTEYWLKRRFISYDKLYMRLSRDKRDDTLVKLDILERLRLDGFEPFWIFDDRDKVVKMWRDQGLSCFQVASGNF